MAWAYIASSAIFGGSTNAATKALTLGASASVGSRIIIATMCSDTVEPATAVSDSLNGTYVEDNVAHVTDGTNLCRMSVFSVEVISAGAAVITINSHRTASANLFVTGDAVAYTGLALGITPVDVKSSATGTGGSAASGSTGAITSANELVLGCYIDDGWSITPTVGTGFTLRGTANNNIDGDIMIEDKDSGASGTQAAATGTGNPGGSATWAMLCTVYKLAGAAAVRTPYNPWMQRAPLLAQ